MEVKATGLPSGTVNLSGSVSSQYLTALLMAAPLATEGDGALPPSPARPPLLLSFVAQPEVFLRQLPERVLIICRGFELPLLSSGVEIIIKDELVSKPYVDMTIKLMARFGVVVNQINGLQHMKVRRLHS